MAKKKSTSAAAAAAAQKKRKHESPLTASAKDDSIISISTTKNKDPKQRRQKRKSKQVLKDEAEERRLTAMLFGGATATGDVHFNQHDNDDDDDNHLVETNVTDENEKEDEDESPSLLFEIDRTGADTNKDEVGQQEQGESKSEQYQHHQESEEEDNEDDDDNDSDNADDNKPAWVDDDDDDVQVDLLRTDRLRKLRTSRGEDTKAKPLSGAELQQRLRTRYKSTMQVNAQTGWAKLDDEHDDNNKNDEDDDEAAALQSSSQPLLLQGTSASSGRLPPNILNVVRCPDANQADYNQAVVQAVQFHPGSDPNRPLLLTAGLDKTLRFFQVGSEKSEKIHGIHFPKLPIYSASFLGDTGKVVVSGRRPFFYIYDSIVGKLDLIPKISGREEKSLERCVPSPDGKLIAFFGNDGYIILVDVQSKQWIANLKMNGSVRAVSFTPDGEYIMGSGSDGDVYRWEVKSRRCVERFSNQDGTISSFLATSSRRHIAVGAESGVVNLYSDDYSRRRKAAKDFGVQRSPIKSIMNMQTSADMLRFNHDGQILAMSSRREKNSMKLLHVPTATVFSNWPTSKTPLNYVWSMDFSPQSKFLAVGNDKGKCLLYQLQHYSRD